MLPWPAASARPAGARPAYPNQRSNSPRSAEDGSRATAGGREEVSRGRRDLGGPKTRRAASKAGTKAGTARQRLHSIHLQQHAGDDYRSRGERARMEQRRGRWLQGFAEEHTVRGEPGGGRCSEEGHGARGTKRRRVREGAWLWSRSGHSAAPDVRAQHIRHHRCHSNSTQRLSAAQEAAGVKGPERTTTSAQVGARGSSRGAPLAFAGGCTRG